VAAVTVLLAGPIKALVQERQMDWQARFGQALGLKVIQLTGDDDSLSLDDLESADVICSTPEKFGEHFEDPAAQQLGLRHAVYSVTLTPVLHHDHKQGPVVYPGCGAACVLSLRPPAASCLAVMCVQTKSLGEWSRRVLWASSQR
jgi:hypothetical protein